MKNYEKFRGMSVEELAEWINHKCTCDMCAFYGANCAADFTKCQEGITGWLNEEADR